MPEAVFQAGRKHQKLIEQHRKVVSSLHQGEGREIIAEEKDVFLPSLQ